MSDYIYNELLQNSNVSSVDNVITLRSINLGDLVQVRQEKSKLNKDGHNLVELNCFRSFYPKASIPELNEISYYGNIEIERLSSHLIRAKKVAGKPKTSFLKKNFLISFFENKK